MHLNIMVIGHVASGKSTTTGHLTYKCRGIDKRTIEKLKKTAEADCAVLTLASGVDEFEVASPSMGRPVSMLLAHMLGMKQLIVAANRMDTTEPPYSSACFEVSDKVKACVKTISYNSKDVICVTISG